MKKTFILIPVLVLLLLFAFIKTNKKTLSKKIDGRGFVLIELFTSEGCSSCPPADEAVAEIQKKYADKNILVLCYHVDYWDHLGWKDIFSSHEFTTRQEYYARLFNLGSIYTPQAIVNGAEEFVSSDKIKLTNAIEDQLKQKEESSIKLKAFQNVQGKIDVAYSTTKDDSNKDELILLLVQKSAANKIGKGENEGRTLHHINIVRNFSVLALSSIEETKTFDIPAGLKKEDVFVAAFIQNKKTGKITGIQSSQIN